jgi:hypothetical protein
MTEKTQTKTTPVGTCMHCGKDYYTWSGSMMHYLQCSEVPRTPGPKWIKRD